MSLLFLGLAELRGQFDCVIVYTKTALNSIVLLHMNFLSFCRTMALEHAGISSLTYANFEVFIVLADKDLASFVLGLPGVLLYLQ
jgi:hypothetical protein